MLLDDSSMKDRLFNFHGRWIGEERPKNLTIIKKYLRWYIYSKLMSRVERYLNDNFGEPWED